MKGGGITTGLGAVRVQGPVYVQDYPQDGVWDLRCASPLQPHESPDSEPLVGEPRPSRVEGEEAREAPAASPDLAHAQEGKQILNQSRN